VKRALFALPLLCGCLAFHRGAMPGEPAGSYAELQGARVRYAESGSGPAVILLHGFASALETWAAVAPELAKSHRVLALDLKGFGWTDRPEGDYSPLAQAKLVLALADARGLDRFALVAHSWGSSVALQVALLAPERVTRIALYDAWVYEEQLPSFFVWSRAGGVGETLFSLFYDQLPDVKMGGGFYDKRFMTERLVEEVEKALERPGTKAAALAAVRGQRYAEVQARYGTLRQPVLLLWGREDKVTTLGFGERLRSQLPNAQLEIYPRCGHFPMIEAAAASTARLAQFLEAER
jgi:pimeloyl-ACP methyl ester carboxylesterase